MDNIRFKSRPVSIPEDNPFKEDLLGRQESAAVLTDLVTSLSEPFVLSIDSPWGTGKTTFLKMWLQQLRNQNVPCLQFNAWENDFSDEPLVSLVGELGAAIDAMKLPESQTETAKRLYEKAKKAGARIISATVPTMLKMATYGILDVSEQSEGAIADLASDIAKQRIERYEADKNTISQFKEDLRGLVDALSKKNGGEKNSPVVFVIDELDRCRPTYAISLLEKIKHLFSVEGLVFVLAIDRKQLGESIKALYGAIDDDGYLRRFIDLEYRLPEPDNRKFSVALFDRFSLDETLDAKPGDTSHDSESIREFIPKMFSLFEFSLRVQEQCFTQLAIVLKTTPANNFLYGVLLVLLLCLRSKNRVLYVRYCTGKATPNDVLEYLSKLPGGQEFVQSDAGCIVEAHLVKGVSNEDVRRRLQSQYANVMKAEPPNEASQRASRVYELFRYIGRNSRSMTEYLYKKIEISHRFVRPEKKPQMV
ncbi:MAG TPA: P-loop NTPase fold protein [Verrucomicrobiae bacterium]